MTLHQTDYTEADVKSLKARSTKWTHYKQRFKNQEFSEKLIKFIYTSKYFLWRWCFSMSILNQEILTIFRNYVMTTTWGIKTFFSETHTISSKFYTLWELWKNVSFLRVQTTPGVLEAGTGGFLKWNGILKNFAKFSGKYLCQSLFFNKPTGLSLWAFLNF